MTYIYDVKRRLLTGNKGNLDGSLNVHIFRREEDASINGWNKCGGETITIAENPNADVEESLHGASNPG